MPRIPVGLQRSSFRRFAHRLHTTIHQPRCATYGSWADALWDELLKSMVGPAPGHASDLRMTRKLHLPADVHRTMGLEQSNYRPPWWWFLAADPQGAWLTELAETATMRRDPLGLKM